MKWEHVLIVAFLAAVLFAVRPDGKGAAAVRSLGDAAAAVAVAGL